MKKCTNRNAEQRPSAGEIINELADILDRMGYSSRPPSPEPAGRRAPASGQYSYSYSRVIGEDDYRGRSCLILCINNHSHHNHLSIYSLLLLAAAVRRPPECGLWALVSMMTRLGQSTDEVSLSNCAEYYKTTRFNGSEATDEADSCYLLPRREH